MTVAAEKLCVQCESAPRAWHSRRCVDCDRQRNTELKRGTRERTRTPRSCRLCGNGLPRAAHGAQRHCDDCSRAMALGVWPTERISHGDADPVQPLVASSQGVAEAGCAHCGSRSLISDDLGVRCLACGRAR